MFLLLLQRRKFPEVLTLLFCWCPCPSASTIQLNTELTYIVMINWYSYHSPNWKFGKCASFIRNLAAFQHFKIILIRAVVVFISVIKKYCIMKCTNIWRISWTKFFQSFTYWACKNQWILYNKYEKYIDTASNSALQLIFE